MRFGLLSGHRGSPVAQYILDMLGLSATAAYSTRKLRTAYTGAALRVCRSSDNTEQDIGFIGNNLDTAALLAFVGAGDGFVSVWYDQGGSSRNMTQATAANQPRIVTAGVSLGAVGIDSGKVQRLLTSDAAFGLASSGLTICSAMKSVSAGSSAAGIIYGLGSVTGARVAPATSALGRNLELRVASLSSPLQTFSGSACTIALTKTAAANNSAIQTKINNGSASNYAASGIAAMDNTFGINGVFLSGSGFHEHYEHIVFAEKLSDANLTSIARSQGAYYGITVA